MNYADVKWVDSANGEGVRISLFVSGCCHGCEYCFNKEAWNFKYGSEYTQEIRDEIIQKLSKIEIRGLSVLGGEPMHPINMKDVADLVIRTKALYPEKDIWLWSGYTYEELLGVQQTPENLSLRKTILENIDVLVDGRFEQDLKDLTLRFRGSSNQRIIDVKKTLSTNKVVIKDI